MNINLKLQTAKNIDIPYIYSISFSVSSRDMPINTQRPRPIELISSLFTKKSDQIF